MRHFFNKTHCDLFIMKFIFFAYKSIRRYLISKNKKWLYLLKACFKKHNMLILLLFGHVVEYNYANGLTHY